MGREHKLRKDHLISFCCYFVQIALFLPILGFFMHVGCMTAVINIRLSQLESGHPPRDADTVFTGKMLLRDLLWEQSVVNMRYSLLWPYDLYCTLMLRGMIAYLILWPLFHGWRLLKEWMLRVSNKRAAKELSIHRIAYTGIAV